MSNGDTGRRRGRPRLDLTEAERLARRRAQDAERQRRRRARLRNGARQAIIDGDVADEIDDKGPADFSRRVSQILRQRVLRDFA